MSNFTLRKAGLLSPHHLLHRAPADPELSRRTLDRPDSSVGLANPLTEGLVGDVGAQPQTSTLQVATHGLLMEAKLLSDLLDRVASLVQLRHLPNQPRPEVAVDALGRRHGSPAAIRTLGISSPVRGATRTLLGSMLHHVPPAGFPEVRVG